MPKVRLSQYAKKTAPPIDWLWAAVLERQIVLGYDLKRMANVAGISYDIMRRYIRKSPWLWPEKVRDDICREFGIETIRSVIGAPSQR